MYVCKANNGDWFTASEDLAEVLTFATAVRLAGNNAAFKVYTGTEWDARGPYRWAKILRGALIRAREDGSYDRFTLDRFDRWTPAEKLPDDVEQALCHALGIPVRREWTAEEILRQEG